MKCKTIQGCLQQGKDSCAAGWTSDQPLVGVLEVGLKIVAAPKSVKVFLVFQFWVTGTWFLFGIELHPNSKSVIKSQKILGIRQGLMSLRLSKYVFFCKSCSWPTAIPSLFGGQAAQRFQRDLWIYGSILKRTSLGGCLKNLMAPHEAKWRTRPLYMGDLLIEVVWGFKIASRRRTNRTRSWRSNLKYVFASRSNRCAKIMWFAVHLALLRLGYGSNFWSPKNWMAAWIQRMTKSCLLNVDLYWPMRSTSLDSGHNS